MRVHKNASKQAVRIPLHLVRPHPADPFKPYGDDKLRELAESIASYGLFEPIIVKEKGDGTYAILAGKNRANACGLNGQAEIEAYICDADEDTAYMIITDSNLKHRDRLLPSERGFSYRMQLEALKRQGKRSDLEEGTESDLYNFPTSCQIDTKLRADKTIAAHNALSASVMQRFIRLTYLTPEILEYIDNGHMPFMAGVDLSYLDTPSQTIVYEQLLYGAATGIDLKKSAHIKQLYKKHGTFTEDTLNALRFQSRGISERVVPLINRKMLNTLNTDIPLPEDDEELIHLFLAFLRDTFKAHGSLDILTVRSEVFY
ncbi:MAG: ParB N-terminal domain-containing protein [Defluviitaleaceae bacterium]|nr:ParB N-terminal domain-containing protein [Defluviitaleaceae bacterium]